MQLLLMLKAKVISRETGASEFSSTTLLRFKYWSLMLPALIPVINNEEELHIGTWNSSLLICRPFQVFKILKNTCFMEAVPWRAV